MHLCLPLPMLGSASHAEVPVIALPPGALGCGRFYLATGSAAEPVQQESRARALACLTDLLLRLVQHWCNANQAAARVWSSEVRMLAARPAPPCLSILPGTTSGSAACQQLAAVAIRSAGSCGSVLQVSLQHVESKGCLPLHVVHRLGYQQQSNIEAGAICWGGNALKWLTELRQAALVPAETQSLVHLVPPALQPVAVEKPTAASGGSCLAAASAGVMSKLHAVLQLPSLPLCDSVVGGGVEGLAKALDACDHDQVSRGNTLNLSRLWLTYLLHRHLHALLPVLVRAGEQ